MNYQSKTMKKYLALITVFAALCACEKAQENTPEEAVPQTGAKQIITATVDVATKVTYSENTPGGGGGISSVWAEGDKFYAIQDGNTVVTFNLVSGAGNTTATFEAEATGVTASTSWKAVLGGHASVHGTEIHCGFTDQGGFLTSLNNYNYVVADGTGLTPSFDFENGQKLTYLMRIKLPAGIKCIEYTCPSWFKVTGDEVASHNAIGDNDPYSGIPTRTITLASASSAGDLLYLAVPAVNHFMNYILYNNKQYKNRQTGVILTFLNDDSENATLSNGTVLGLSEAHDLSAKGGQIGTFDLSAMPLIKRPKPSDAITFTASNMSTSNYGGKLTQQASTVETHWAPFNVGAEQPYEFGNYYSFGGTSTQSAYTFTNHWPLRLNANGNNVYCIIAKEVTGTGISYCTISNSRFDVARVKWGKAWRMAHILEFKVFNNYTHGVETVSGNNCMKVTNSSSQTLYMPFTGYIDDTTLKHYDSSYDMCSWTADQIAVSKDNATYKRGYFFIPTLSNGAPDFDSYDGGRCYGLTVRAVLSSSVME